MSMEEATEDLLTEQVFPEQQEFTQTVDDGVEQVDTPPESDIVEADRVQTRQSFEAEDAYGFNSGI